jgi:hypothetical protein
VLCTKLPSISQFLLSTLIITIFHFPITALAESSQTPQAANMAANNQTILLAKADLKVPEDFTMVIHSGPRMKRSAAAALFLSLNAKGTAKYYKTNVKGKSDFSLIKEFTLSPGMVNKIYATTISERFFQLKPHYKDPEILDGDFAQIEIHANGKSYRVRTVNIKVDAFDRIVTTVNNFLPKGVIIYYNAMTVDSYKKVER